MSYTCLQCGAVYPTGESCRERFDLGQFKEMEQPSYGAVHHLSVPCYMLQHNAYSREGWLATRELLYRFIYCNLTPVAARREIQTRMNSGNRTWSFTKGAKLPGVDQIAWSFSLADVCLDPAERYCADVRRWAEHVLADTDGLVRALEGAA